MGASCCKDANAVTASATEVLVVVPTSDSTGTSAVPGNVPPTNPKKTYTSVDEATLRALAL